MNTEFTRIYHTLNSLLTISYDAEQQAVIEQVLQKVTVIGNIKTRYRWSNRLAAHQGRQTLAVFAGLTYALATQYAETNGGMHDEYIPVIIDGRMLEETDRKERHGRIWYLTRRAATRSDEMKTPQWEAVFLDLVRFTTEVADVITGYSPYVAAKNATASHANAIH